jgi:hypothetical protein
VKKDKACLKNYVKALIKKESHALADCYSEEANFFDPIFDNLDKENLVKYWELRFTTYKDLKILVLASELYEHSASIKWFISYKQKNKKIRYSMVSILEIRNGKIIKQFDHFHFWKMAMQAYGFMGFFLGWTKLMNARVKKLYELKHKNFKKI